jgi:chromosomal replication initiation ATPase DnaA
MTPRAELLNCLAAFAAAHDLTLNDLFCDSRERRITSVRQAAYALTKTLRPLYSLPEIGRVFGGRDHTTIIHGLRRHAARLAWFDFLIWAGDVKQPDLFEVAA